MIDETSKSANYLREEEYRKYCVEEGIEDKSPQDTLLSWLNDLGVCFSYKSKEISGTVKEFKVLRPEWITNGVYKIINSKEAKDCNGFIRHEIITQVLEHSDDVNPIYRNTEGGFILGMMRDFMLSYPVEDSEFIPMLTAESEPNIPPLKDAIHLQIEYEVPLPAAVFYSLVTIMKADVDRAKTWRNGTHLISMYDDSRAIVRFGKTKKILDIYVTGTNKATYLSYIRRNLDHAQRDMNTSFDEFVEYTVKDKTALLKIERLLKQLKRGKTEDFADELDEDVDIIDVLSPIAPGDALNILREKLQARETEIRHLRQDKDDRAFSKEFWKAIYEMITAIDAKTTATHENTTAILTNIINIIKKIENNADEQRFSLQVIFDELNRRKDSITDPHILSMLETILAEVRTGNTKSFSDILLQLYSVAGSNASFISLALMIQDILQNIPL
jgi:hypothetical protein